MITLTNYCPKPGIAHLAPSLAGHEAQSIAKPKCEVMRAFSNQSPVQGVEQDLKGNGVDRTDQIQETEESQIHFKFMAMTAIFASAAGLSQAQTVDITGITFLNDRIDDAQTATNKDIARGTDANRFGNPEFRPACRAAPRSAISGRMATTIPRISRPVAGCVLPAVRWSKPSALRLTTRMWRASGPNRMSLAFMTPTITSTKRSKPLRSVAFGQTALPPRLTKSPRTGSWALVRAIGS